MKNQTIRWVLIGLIVIAGVYLIADHGQHLAPYLPFVFLLGMFAMHFFMPHGGHGNHDDNKHEHGDDKKQ